MNQNLKNTSWADRIGSDDQERKANSSEVSQSPPPNNSFESSMDSQFSYAHSNKSSISFESIQTTERLLDKLDLSLEDELILQEALLEEETRREIRNCHKQVVQHYVCLRRNSLH